MKKSVLICSLVFFGMFCQIHLTSAVSEKQKIQSLIASAEKFREIDIDSSDFYARKAYSLAEANNLNFEKAEAIYNIGIIHCMRSEFDKAKECFDKALLTQESLGNNKEIAILHNAYGQLYRFTSEYSKSLVHLFKACSIKIGLDDELSLARSYNNLGVVYRQLTDYPKALDYCLKAHHISLRLNDTIEIVRTGISVGDILYDLNKYHEALRKYEYTLGMLNEKMQYKLKSLINNIANIHSELGDFEAAEKGYRQYYETAVLKGYKYEQAIALLNIGHLYFKQKEYDEAEKYYLQSKLLSHKLEEKIGVADANYAVGQIKVQYGAHAEAIKYFSASMKIFQDKNIESKLVSTYLKLNDIFTKLNDFEKAHNYLVKYMELHDQIAEKEKKSYEEAIVMKAEAENEIQILGKKMEYQKAQYEKLIQIIIISVISVVVIVLILILFYKTKKKLAYSKNKLIRKEEFQNSIYHQMSEELKMLHLYVAFDIVKMENNDNYRNISASFTEFSKKYNRIMFEMKTNNN